MSSKSIQYFIPEDIKLQKQTEINGQPTKK